MPLFTKSGNRWAIMISIQSRQVVVVIIVAEVVIVEVLILVVVLVLKFDGLLGIIPEEVKLLKTICVEEPERITFTPLKLAVYPLVTAPVKSKVAVAAVVPILEITLADAAV